MKPEELIAQVVLKPNCGLENTRAALVVRRIAPFCDTLTWHPRTVKSDRKTIAYLRDHGLFIRFSSTTPEQVLMAIKGSFFVDRCSFVENADAIPPYDASLGADGDTGDRAFAIPTTFSGRDEQTLRDDELLGLLARFEETHRALRAHAEYAMHDRKLNEIVFSHAQAVDGLRTAVSRSRVEPFKRIEPSLRALADDYSQRFGVLVNLEVADGNTALDRSVLASMEETVKHMIRAFIRDGIEPPDERTATGKSARATIRMRLENDGSDVACRIEHDGRPFDLRAIGQRAFERGLLARPLETYTDDEIGAFLLLPGFATTNDGQAVSGLSQFSEIGSMLQHAGGRGYVRNTEQGTAEVSLHFPVPFTVIEAALVRTDDAMFALPAQQISHFEAFRPERIETVGANARQAHNLEAPRAFYTCDDGKRHELLNVCGTSTLAPFAADHPTFVVVLSVFGEQRCLAVNDVDGYETLSVSQLPALLDRKTMRAAGCIGYAVLENGALCSVVSARHLLNAIENDRSRHA